MGPHSDVPRGFHPFPELTKSQNEGLMFQIVRVRSGLASAEDSDRLQELIERDARVAALLERVELDRGSKRGAAAAHASQLMSGSVAPTGPAETAPRRGRGREPVLRRAASKVGLSGVRVAALRGFALRRDSVLLLASGSALVSIALISGLL